ncbi:MAG: InlB B-repeat-containing protein [Clostridia bacterium]|nr:InlB B-repeat-containing protein [Clostridia bacterium]
MDVTSFILGFKKGAASGTGGGSVEGVHTVTFMTEDGSAVLYERLVVDGDDCANVVDRGLLAMPTKESTVQYNYTYSGWALTSGGSASASALKSVTADRTVYAAFASAVRYYTVTYYDSDGETVLKTESLAYGSMPSYAPTHDEYNFDKWTPDVAAVTGDASYTVVWKAKPAFATLSWSEIAEIAASGQAASTFNIGDEKDIVFNDGLVLKCAIADFDHDDLADGTGKAPITVVLTNVYNLPVSAGYNGICGAKNTIWEKTNLRAQIANAMTNLPSDLQSVIKPVTKKSLGTSASTYVTTTDSLWALSCYELGINASYDGSTKYPYFSDATKRILTDTTGTAKDYFVRSHITWNTKWYVIDESGAHESVNSDANYANIHLHFGFCI